jgi:hypothetical protein
MSQKQLNAYFIPDISYHLIFCYLRLSELSLVLQCNKEWNRILTAPSFLTIFRHNTALKIGDKHKIQTASNHPFASIIRNIVIGHHAYSMTSTMIHLVGFHRLDSL